MKTSLVRHCVESNNVNESLYVLDPTRIRHVTVRAKQIDDMSGPVDTLTHLNLDFPDHRLALCIIAEKFERGAKIRFRDEGFIFATVHREAFAHLGSVDYAQRLDEMRKRVGKLRKSRKRKKDDKK